MPACQPDAVCFMILTIVASTSCATPSSCGALNAALGLDLFLGDSGNFHKDDYVRFRLVDVNGGLHIRRTEVRAAGRRVAAEEASAGTIQVLLDVWVKS